MQEVSEGSVLQKAPQRLKYWGTFVLGHTGGTAFLNLRGEKSELGEDEDEAPLQGKKILLFEVRV